MGRNREINEKTKDERREQILSAALKLFSSDGLAATKITDISAEAGISQGLVYHYYESKNEIFVALIDFAFDRLIEACRILENMTITPREKIEMAINGIYKNMAENESSAQYHLLIAQANLMTSPPAKARVILAEKSDIPYEIIARIIRKGQKDGTIKKGNAKDMALVFWTAIKGLAIHKTSRGNKFKMPDPKILSGIFFEVS